MLNRVPYRIAVLSEVLFRGLCDIAWSLVGDRALSLPSDGVDTPVVIDDVDDTDEFNNGT